MAEKGESSRLLKVQTHVIKGGGRDIPNDSKSQHLDKQNDTADRYIIENDSTSANNVSARLLDIVWYFIELNPLPDDKILDWSKLKQIADDTLSALGGYLDCSHLTVLKNIYITEIYMKLEALQRLYRSTGLIFL